MTNPEQTPRFFRVWDRIDAVFCRVEGWLLVVSLLVMVAMTFTQVVLRNLLDQGVLWFDPVVRHLVVWIGFLGAAVATREKKHVNVDALSRYIKGAARHGVNIVVSGFATAVTFFLFLASIQFIKNTMALGERIHQFFPSWIAQMVFPYAFGIMALRFLYDFLLSITLAAKGKAPLHIVDSNLPAEETP